jgi:hypothetical protein
VQQQTRRLHLQLQCSKAVKEPAVVARRIHAGSHVLLLEGAGADERAIRDDAVRLLPNDEVGGERCRSAAAREGARVWRLRHRRQERPRRRRRARRASSPAGLARKQVSLAMASTSVAGTCRGTESTSLAARARRGGPIKSLCFLFAFLSVVSTHFLSDFAFFGLGAGGECRQKLSGDKRKAKGVCGSVAPYEIRTHDLLLTKEAL